MNESRMPLIGDKAPAFVAKTTQGEIRFPEDYQNKWVILFSHPADFTPVCTTEFMTFARMQNDFKKLNTELIGLAVDSLYAHIAWLRTIEERIKWNGMENMNITFPLIEDIKMEVANKYGMIQPNASTTQAVRAVFIIDPKAVVRCVLYYPLTTGRNFDEIMRIIKALQTSDAQGVATPADWKPGEDVIVPPPNSCGVANERMDNTPAGMYCLDWFMCFKKDSGKAQPDPKSQPEPAKAMPAAQPNLAPPTITAPTFSTQPASIVWGMGSGSQNKNAKRPTNYNV